MWGGVLGGVMAATVMLGASRVHALRRPRLATRVLPYVRDLPQLSADAELAPRQPPSALVALFGPTLRSAADTLERVLGGAASVRRRLERANLPITLHEFRIEQVTWGLLAFAGAALLSLPVALRTPGRAIPLLILCGVAFVAGVLLRENRLTSQVAQRERAMLAEFPTVAELLALSVAAGEGPVSALDRVVTRSRGEMTAELARVLAEIRTGTPVARALDEMAKRSGLPVVARFAEGLAVAVERGTPLTDVLHAQAADVREAGRRALIESGARKEVLMMVPVVFLVLPVTVLFAFWPGVVGLSLVVP